MSAVEPPEEGGLLNRVYIARTVMQSRCKAEMMAGEESSLGELTLVGAH